MASGGRDYYCATSQGSPVVAAAGGRQKSARRGGHTRARRGDTAL